ncbi:DUF6602 domain-containing protein [Bacillus thuringiensis]
MINSVADILLKLKEEEEKKITEFSEKYPSALHSTIIGDMYEGIAKGLLEKTIFKELDLRVTSGQITNNNGDLSHEVDCMIVVGEGDPIPNTDKHIYHISNVIAVIEVKKNLNKNDLFDSYFKMAELSQMFEPREMGENEYKLFRDAFRSIVGMEVPKHADISKYNLETQMIYHTLLIETLMPLRIVFGFYGYSSMKSLREGFIKLLQEHISTKDNQIMGFSPGNFPNQVFTRSSSLVKTNGMPYVSPLDDSGFWEVYTSSSHNPLLHFLELLWTKLSYKYGISSDLFGEEFKMEGLIRYIGAKPRKENDLTGWELRYVELPKDFDVSPFFYEWEPYELTQSEFLLVNWLCEGESINTKSDIFIDLIKRARTDEDSFIKELNNKKLVYKDEENNLLLLTDECITGIKHGNYYAGENKDGKMMRWLLKRS